MKWQPHCPLNPNGTLIKPHGDGRQSTNFGADERGFTGLQSNVDSCAYRKTQNTQYFAWRVTTNGSLDATFSGTGKRFSFMPGAFSWQRPDYSGGRKIVIVGATDSYDFAVVRLNVGYRKNLQQGRKATVDFGTDFGYIAFNR
jgi:hypothetical protein